MPAGGVSRLRQFLGLSRRRKASPTLRGTYPAGSTIRVPLLFYPDPYLMPCFSHLSDRRFFTPFIWSRMVLLRIGGTCAEMTRRVLLPLQGDLYRRDPVRPV